VRLIAYVTLCSVTLLPLLNEFCAPSSVCVLLKINLCFFFFPAFEFLLHFNYWYFVKVLGIKWKILHLKSLPRFVRDWSQLIMDIKTIFRNILPMQKLEPGQLSLIVIGVGDGRSGVRPLAGARNVSRFLVQSGCPVPLVQGFPSVGTASGDKADHFFLSSTEVMNDQHCTSTHSVCLYDMDRNNCTFIF